MGYSVVDVSELPGEGPGGGVKKTRKALGARAFGFNWFDLPAGAAGFEHDETSTAQEEVVVVIAGSGTLRIDGEEIELSPGRPVRIAPAPRANQRGRGWADLHHLRRAARGR